VLFFNAKEPDSLTANVVAELDVYAHLISSIAAHEITVPRMLLGALRTATDMMYERDPETGAHFERMARFTRLSAQELAVRGRHWFDDEFIERGSCFLRSMTSARSASPIGSCASPAGSRRLNSR
jgi:hypothetical protein